MIACDHHALDSNVTYVGSLVRSTRPFCRLTHSESCDPHIIPLRAFAVMLKRSACRRRRRASCSSGRQQRTKQYVPSSPWALRRQLYFFCQTSSPARALMQEQCTSPSGAAGSGVSARQRRGRRPRRAGGRRAPRTRAVGARRSRRRPCSVEKLGRSGLIPPVPKRRGRRGSGARKRLDAEPSTSLWRARPANVGLLLLYFCQRAVSCRIVAEACEAARDAPACRTGSRQWCGQLPFSSPTAPCLAKSVVPCSQALRNPAREQSTWGTAIPSFGTSLMRKLAGTKPEGAAGGPTGRRVSRRAPTWAS